MLRAVIIDDEQKGIKALKLILENHAPDIKVVAQHTSAREGIGCIEDYKPEIVFLDINMPQMDGFELLNNLNWRNFHLIFTTAHPEYGLKALKNNAIDYLLKPIDPEDLRFAINKVKTLVDNHGFIKELNYARLLKELYPEQPKKIIVNSRTGTESIELSDILYFESVSNYTQICHKDSQLALCSKTMREFELQVCEGHADFMRVHHSFIINLRRVTRYLKVPEMIVMQNDRQIPLARSKRGVFYKWLGA